MENFINDVNYWFSEFNLKEQLNQYLNKYQNCKKWRIYSDYCLNDKNKPSDVLVYTIIPYESLIEYDSLKAKINKCAPQDIKNVNDVSPLFLEILKSEQIFSFCFIVTKKRMLYAESLEKEKEVLIEGFKDIFDNLNSLQYSPDVSKAIKLTIKKIQEIRQELNKKHSNIKLIKDICLNAALSSYIAYLISYHNKSELIGWFSDRDSMIQTFNFIAQDLFWLNHELMVQQENLQNSTNITGSLPSSKDEEIWYDSFIRIPDYICGALADVDWDKNNEKRPMKPKFCKILEEVIADNPNIVVVNLDISDFFEPKSRDLKINKNN